MVATKLARRLRGSAVAKVPMVGLQYRLDVVSDRLNVFDDLEASLG